MEFTFPVKNTRVILALGAESAGNFSVYANGKIYFSENFGDLLEEKNWLVFQKAVLKYLKDKKIKPDVILTDLHPLFRTTLCGKELAKKYKAEFIQVQHHHAHIFSAIGDKIIQNSKFKIQNYFYGIAMDGTGVGTDGKIWGGEVLRISNFQFPISKKILNTKNKNPKFNIERIGHLENQTLIGADAAIREPARVLLAILSKFMDKISIYQYMEKYYSCNEFELLYNQREQNFNCLETSSTGRVLDAISLLLGFCKNERKYKHESIDLLEKNSTKPYSNLRPKIRKNPDGKYILDTSYVINYVISAIGGSAFGRNYSYIKNKQRLAATAQLYIAQGLFEIIKVQDTRYKQKEIYFSGGIANNKIISDFLKSKGTYKSEKVPSGDAGISFGQVIYYLLK